MNSPKPGTFRKSFDDPYSLSRESQILGYLNQRKAPAPLLVISHVEDGYIEMAHAGQDLRAWLTNARPPATLVCQVLAKAVRALVEVADLGVWHLDIAARNVMVTPQQSGPGVLLIDFGNAISTDFPLRKPLWLMPSPALHPQLCAALVEDWRGFFVRHGLTPPARWDCAFDVPMQAYQKDWTTDPAVELETRRWSWLAHGIGQLLTEAAQYMPTPAPTQLPSGEPLMNLEGEPQSRQAIQSVLNALDGAGQAGLHAVGRDDATPRPRLMETPTPPPTAAQPSLASATPDSKPTSQTWARVRAALVIVAGIACALCGWVLLDAVYSVVRPPTTWLLLGGVSASALATLAGLLRWVLRPADKSAWPGLLLIQAIGQGVLVMDLWVHRAGAPALGLAAVGPLLTLVCAVLSRRR